MAQTQVHEQWQLQRILRQRTSLPHGMADYFNVLLTYLVNSVLYMSVYTIS